MPEQPLTLQPDDWPSRDSGTTLRILAFWWAQVLDGLEADELERAPAHDRPTVRACLDRSLAALGTSSADDADVTTTLSALDASADTYAERLLGPARGDIAPETASGLALAAVEPLVAACATLRAVGLRTPSTSGAVVQLAASGGGVPKTPLAVGQIGHRGLDGDRQRSRQHHGRVWQALCLWSADVIEALQAEGHPIGFGSAGENVTVRGLDWPAVRPGVRLALGDEVRVEISAFAVPCQKNARWFVGGDVQRMSQERHPGWSRVYAWVLQPGTVRTGDAVTTVR